MGQFRDDSHCVFWAFVTVSGGVPTLVSSFNVTSITDTATGQLTVTATTGFTSANWCCSISVERASTLLTVANARLANIRSGGLASGSILCECNDSTAITALAADPTSWHIKGHGAQ